MAHHEASLHSRDQDGSIGFSEFLAAWMLLEFLLESALRMRRYANQVSGESCLRQGNADMSCATGKPSIPWRALTGRSHDKKCEMPCSRSRCASTSQ